jgi:hypothetical protein
MILIFGTLREKACDDWGQHHIFLVFGGLIGTVKDRGERRSAPVNLTGGRILHLPEVAVSIIFLPDAATRTAQRGQRPSDACFQNPPLLSTQTA